jgi:hypothetical protein
LVCYYPARTVYSHFLKGDKAIVLKLITYEVALTIMAYLRGALTEAPSTNFAREIYEQGSRAACGGLLAKNTIG